MSNLCGQVLVGIIIAELRHCVKLGGGRPGLPVPNSPYGLRGRKATLNLNSSPAPLQRRLDVKRVVRQNKSSGFRLPFDLTR